MSLAAAIRDARHTRRVQRARAAVWRRYAKKARVATPRWRLFVAGVLCSPFAHPLSALLVPFLLWYGTQKYGGLCRLGALVMALSSGLLFVSQALRFSANDVLRLPSKAGLLLRRLSYQLPILIFVGVAWAGGYAIVLGEFVQRHPVRGAMLLLAVTLAPLAATIGKLHIRLIGERVSTLGPLFVSTVAGVFLYSELVDHSARFEAGEIVVDVCVAILGMLATIRLIYEWIRQPRQHLQVLGPELANLPRAAFCFSLLAPAASLREAPILVPIAWCALPFLLCVSLVTLVRLVAAVHQAEEDTDGGVVHSADQHGLGDDKEVQAPLPSTHSGPRSLMRAALYLHRRSSWFRPGELRTPRQVVRHLGRILPMVLYHGWGVLLAWLALAHPSGSRLPATLGVFAGLTAPTFVAVNLSPSLRRLGVDYVDQVRHNLRALLWLAVLPTMLAGGIAGTIAGWDDRRALVLAILAATFAVRAGWRGLARQAEGAWTPAWVFLTTIALLVLSYLAPLQSWPAAFAGAVLGLVGLVLRWRGLEEVTLANAVCAREEL